MSVRAPGKIEKDGRTGYGEYDVMDE